MTCAFRAIYLRVQVYWGIILALASIKEVIPLEDTWTPGRYISMINRKCQLYLDRVLAQYGLGKGLYISLVEIAREEGINQRTLSERVVLDEASVTRSVRKLVQRKFIEILKDPDDSRINRLYITPIGREALEKVKTHLDQWDSIAIDHFSAQERDDLVRLLKKMESNLSFN